VCPTNQKIYVIHPSLILPIEYNQVQSNSVVQIANKKNEIEKNRENTEENRSEKIQNKRQSR
jgi:hypothetical protein